MTNLFLSIITAATKVTKANFVTKTRQVEAVQEEFLLSLLKAYQNTEFAKKYKLQEIKNVEQFRNLIPILAYSSYEVFVERITKGENNILTPDPVVHLNRSSGSTGKQKLIPVTKRSRQILNRINQVATGFSTEAIHKRGNSMGEMLMTTSTLISGRTSSGIPYGTSSSGVLRLNRFTKCIYKQLFAQPPEALEVLDPVSRNYICLLFALQNPNLKIIGATFPVLALQIANDLELYSEELIHNLKNGELAPWLKIKPELRHTIEKQFFPNSKRATQLQEILRSEGKLTPLLAWQNLAVIATARGGTSDFYFEKFPAYFGDTPIFGGIYASSEATFGACYDLNTDGAILAIDSGFFEFIPQKEWDAEQPKTLLASEVQAGGYYRILVTNYNGLYRYNIGDVVEVVGFYEQAPIIVFRHRVGGLLSATSEKTSEFHVIQAVKKVQEEFNSPLENFCVTLSENEFPPRYLLNIELSPSCSLAEPEKFLAKFDQALQKLNVSYEEKRQHEVLPSPHLRILASGSFSTLRQRLLDKGIPESHLKFPHISEDRQLLAGLVIEREVNLSGEH